MVSALLINTSFTDINNCLEASRYPTTIILFTVRADLYSLTVFTNCVVLSNVYS